MNPFIIVEEVRGQVNTRFKDVFNEDRTMPTDEERQTAVDLFNLLVSFIEKKPSSKPTKPWTSTTR